MKTRVKEHFWRKLGAGVMAILLCLTLAACGNTNTQSSEAASESTTSAPSTDTESTSNNSSSDIILSSDELTFPLGMAVNSEAFTGTAYLSPMIPLDDVYNFPQTNNVTFEPGARSGWHTHGGMIILGTGGTGYYQEEGKPAQIIRKGDVVECPEGVKHWHGAAPDSWFSQVVIYDTEYVPEASGEPAHEMVSDEEYANLETEEYAGRNITADNQFMFQRADEPVSLETFNGPVYLSSIIEADNVAEAPGLHYVVFDKGVINNWHTHEGGQILIATDGIGYHQIEGQPVEVLHPGDVALCPPGVKHWHGGSADTEFAHIAVNTNPELTGLEWFDRISDDEYAKLAAENTASKSLVVYFSMPETTDAENMTEAEDDSTVVIDGEVLGNTQYMARIIQEHTGADIFRIEPETPYPTDHETLVDLAAEEKEKNARPVIRGQIEDFERYETVYIGYPIWWSDMPMILYSFFDQYDFSGKTVIPFSTHGGSSFAGTPAEIQRMEPNATMVEGLTISRDRIQDAKQQIIDWVNGLS